MPKGVFIHTLMFVQAASHSSSSSSSPLVHLVASTLELIMLPLL